MTTNEEAACALEALALQLRSAGSFPFGGAFIALPPDGASVDAILLSSTPDIPLFCSTVTGKVELAKAEIAASEHRGTRARW